MNLPLSLSPLQSNRSPIEINRTSKYKVIHGCKGLLIINKINLKVYFECYNHIEFLDSPH